MRFCDVFGVAAAAGLAVLLWSAGCAAQQAEADGDPGEAVNRLIFKANLAIDQAVVKPLAKTYRERVPQGVRDGVHNFVANLGQPAVAVNNLLQGKSRQAWQSVQRLAVNTTLGAGGVVDVATHFGLKPRPADFGETLAVWGVGPGPYVMLPMLGPSTLRDAVGTAVDFALDPLNYVGAAAATYVQAAGSGARVVDTRAAHIEDLDALEQSSLDFYATLRSVYRQHREAEIRDATGAMPAREGRANNAVPEDTP